MPPSVHAPLQCDADGPPIERRTLFLRLFESGLPWACLDQQNGEKVALSRFSAEASRGLAVSALTFLNPETIMLRESSGLEKTT